MTVHINGPTNVEIVPLGKLPAYTPFSDAKVDRVYIVTYKQGDEVECLRLSPTIGRAVLGAELPVRLVDMDIDWRYQ
jgi:hypothetical protein